MKSFLKFVAIMLGIVFLSAFLAPLLFDILPYKFERIFNRLIMIFTIAAVIFSVRAKKLSFPIETLAWKDYGVPHFMTAFAAGLLTLVSVSLVKGGLGMIHWQVSLDSPLAWAERISMSMLSALVIGLIEELFFRGFFFSMLQKKLCWPMIPSIVLTNLFYAVIHFTGGKKIYIGPDPGFSDSLKLLMAPFHNLLDTGSVFPGAMGLFIFGIVLTGLFLKTKSLYPCIGLHAGCVFFLKMDGVLLQHVDRQPLWIYGTGQNYDGLLGWTALLVLGVLLNFFYDRKKIGSAAAFAVILGLSVCPQAALAEEQNEKNWVSFSDQVQENAKAESWGNANALSPLSPAKEETSQPKLSSQPPKKILQTLASEGNAPEASGNLPQTASLTTAKKRTLPVESVMSQEPVRQALNQQDAIRPPQATKPVQRSAPVEVEKVQAENFSSAPVENKIETAQMPAASQAPSSVPSMEAPTVKTFAREGQIPASPELPKKSLPKTGTPADSVSEGRVSAVKKLKVNELLPQEPAYEEDVSGQPKTSVKAVLQEPKPAKRKKSESKKKAASSQKAGEAGEVYSFASHLADVQAILTNDKEDLVNGVWDGERIVFQGDPPVEMAVKKQVTEGGFEHDGISFRPSPAEQIRLRFPDVPPSSHLILRYGFDQVGPMSASKAAVYVKVWLGQHPLKRIRVLNEKGWKEEVLDMGPVAFLKTPIMVTFDVTADEKLDRNFNLSVDAG